MKKFKLTLLFFTASFLSVLAQDSLKLEQAIEVALMNNYTVTIARTTAYVAGVNNNIGNAGFLPSIVASSSPTITHVGSAYDYNQSILPKAPVKGESVNKNINYGVALNWTVFNGFLMFANKERLEALEEQGIANVKVAIENNLVSVINGYYNIVQQQDLIKASKVAIKNYEERRDIAQAKFDIGTIAKTDLLQAKVDLNAQISTMLSQKTALATAKSTFNQLLGRDPNIEFIATDSTIIDYHPDYDTLHKNLEENNNPIKYYEKSVTIAEKTLKQNRSYLYPQLSLNAGYNYNQNIYQVYTFTQTQLIGPQAGFTASWSLFNGFIYRTQIRAAQLGVVQNKFLLKQVTSLQEANLVTAFKSYQNQLVALKLEQDNTVIAKENADIALERFRIGTSNSVDLLTAQKSYIDALGRLIAARYNAKASETQLMQLQGMLVKPSDVFKK